MVEMVKLAEKRKFCAKEWMESHEKEFPPPVMRTRQPGVSTIPCTEMDKHHEAGSQERLQKRKRSPVRRDNQP